MWGWPQVWTACKEGLRRAWIGRAPTAAVTRNPHAQKQCPCLPAVPSTWWATSLNLWSDPTQFFSEIPTSQPSSPPISILEPHPRMAASLPTAAVFVSPETSWWIQMSPLCFIPPAEDALVGTCQAGGGLHAAVALDAIKSVLVAAASSPKHCLAASRRERKMPSLNQQLQKLQCGLASFWKSPSFHCSK